MGDTKNTSNSSGHTADEFATFFANKVDDVRRSTSSTALPDAAVTARHALNGWELVTPEVVVKLIGNAPNKSCQLDVAPTWLVKQYSRLLAPFIALLFNASRSTGCFPAKFKHAIVTPLEKKGTRDGNQLKNYRPVSNSPFLSKFLEKVVQNQLQHHITRGHRRCRLSCNPYHVFGPTGLSSWPVVIYPVHGGSGRHCCTVQLDITCVR